MIAAVLALLVGGAFSIYAYRKQKEDQRAADALFRRTMLELEERAKKEGTFVISYFDKTNGQ